jgi:hypothetical protein
MRRTGLILTLVALFAGAAFAGHALNSPVYTTSPGDFWVAGNADFDGTVVFDDVCTFNADAIFTLDVSVGDDLTVTDDAAVTDSLYVGGNLVVAGWAELFESVTYEGNLPDASGGACLGRFYHNTVGDTGWVGDNNSWVQFWP